MGNTYYGFSPGLEALRVPDRIRWTFIWFFAALAGAEFSLGD